MERKATLAQQLMSNAPSLSKQASTNSATGANAGKDAGNALYEEAVMNSMLSKMSSLMAQKMMNVVEHERNLMIEQHQNVLEGASQQTFPAVELGSDGGHAMDEPEIVADDGTVAAAEKKAQSEAALSESPSKIEEDVKANILKNTSKHNVVLS